MHPSIRLHAHDVFDGDAAHLEHANTAVTRIKWVESGLAVEFIDGDMAIVPEYAPFTAGAAIIQGIDLDLIFGEWVTARNARYGSP